MTEQVRVINAANYERGFLQQTLVLALDPQTLIAAPVTIPAAWLSALQSQSVDFKQNRDAISVSGVDAGGKVTLRNESPTDKLKEIIHIKFPLLLLKPGENFVDRDLFISALEDEQAGKRIESLVGQKDGLFFKDPRVRVDVPETPTVEQTTSDEVGGDSEWV